MPKSYDLSPELIKKLTHFKSQVSIKKFNRNLRNLIIEHLAIQKDEPTFKKQDLLFDLINLFDLLDALENEI